jgi:hypothetical protein
MMKKHILTFSFLLLTSLAISQISGIKESDDIMLELRLKANSINQNRYLNIKGSPYLSTNFIEGTVLLKSDTAFRLLLRYDMYKDIFEYKTGDEIYGIANKRSIKEIVLGDKKFIYYVNKENDSFNSFYQVYKDGNYILLLKRKVIYKEGQQGNGIIPNEPPQFVAKKDEFYIINKSSLPQLVKNKKTLINCFPDKSDSIKKFVKKIEFR